MFSMVAFKVNTTHATMRLQVRSSDMSQPPPPPPLPLLLPLPHSLASIVAVITMMSMQHLAAIDFGDMAQACMIVYHDGDCIPVYVSTCLPYVCLRVSACVYESTCLHVYHMCLPWGLYDGLPYGRCIAMASFRASDTRLLHTRMMPTTLLFGAVGCG